jgi:hypothetical protein
MRAPWPKWRKLTPDEERASYNLGWRDFADGYDRMWVMPVEERHSYRLGRGDAANEYWRARALPGQEVRAAHATITGESRDVAL